MNKKCCDCGKVKPIEKFPKTVSGKRYQPQCWECTFKLNTPKQPAKIIEKNAKPPMFRSEAEPPKQKIDVGSLPKHIPQLPFTIKSVKRHYNSGDTERDPYIPQVNRDYRKCAKCGETKSLKHFYRQKEGPAGYTILCKVCEREARDQRMEKKARKIFEETLRPVLHNRVDVPTKELQKAAKISYDRITAVLRVLVKMKILTVQKNKRRNYYTLSNIGSEIPATQAENIVSSKE